jgi:hypothetical protein
MRLMLVTLPMRLALLLLLVWSARGALPMWPVLVPVLVLEVPLSMQVVLVG